MNNIFSKIFPLKELKDNIKIIFAEKYNLANSNLEQSLNVLQKTLAELRPDLYVVVEFPYVDKTYRDSYYKYFASKRDVYARDCVRVSFFKEKIEDEDFRLSSTIESLCEKYLGFIVVRPTFPNIIGRTLLSPRAVKRLDFVTCLVEYTSVVNGIKMKVEGFPHSSQDSETISCAETTVWGLLEYFGNKYADYRPALPTQINAVLAILSSERLMPSVGLTAAQISYALKEFGFGVKIYSSESYGDEFHKIIRIYVESGIPIVGTLQNEKGIGHALNIVGRASLTKQALDELNSSKELEGQIQLFEFDNLNLDYVFVDDNYPPYQLATINNPASYYDDVRWEGCEITNVIVPLYPKIYLEAGEAKRIGYSLIEGIGTLVNKSVLVKTFLASSRSFKSYLALNDKLDNDAKELLISTIMPKFVWIMELGTKDLLLENLVSGVIIMDATEPKRLGIIAALIEDEYVSNDLTTFKRISLPLQPFYAYSQNLK